MTAEEKLKEYKYLSEKDYLGKEVTRQVVMLAPEHIDLIANLVVERLDAKLNAELSKL